MALITFDPNNKVATLSNNNMTAQVSTINQYALVTTGRTSGKWYWEAKLFFLIKFLLEELKLNRKAGEINA